MRILITGVCGFVGSTLARTWVEHGTEHAIAGVDNLVRPGSETNRQVFKRLGVEVMHRDIRLQSDVDGLPRVDWVIDAAANPSVLAGVDGRTSSRQLLEHNLGGTINLLEYCRAQGAGLVLLSTSRIYSLSELEKVPVSVENDAFHPRPGLAVPGFSQQGVSEEFSTAPPVSLYGAAKFASEQLALEYGGAFNFPVWINRCGVLAGADQFGRPDQGIFSYWIHSWAGRHPLRYVGFDGQGHQVRDCLHPRDLLPLLEAQMGSATPERPRVVNVSGGVESSCSLRQLSAWCADRLGPHTVDSAAASRPYDIPWLVLDSSKARNQWHWSPACSREMIFEEIAQHAESTPDWLEISRD